MHQAIHIFGQKVVDKWVARFVLAQVHLFYQHCSDLPVGPISFLSF